MLVVKTIMQIRLEHAGDKPISSIARDLEPSRKAFLARERVR